MSEFINTIDVLGDDAVIDSIIQRTITEFKDNTVNCVADYVFYQCKALETLEVPNATYISQRALYQCDALENLSIPKVTTIFDNAFNGCTSLKKLVLPAINNITNSAFENCTALETVDIHTACPLKEKNFYGCIELRTLIIRGTTGVPAMSKTSCLTNTPIADGVGYIYVPRELVDSYKAATNWSEYASKIRAIEDYPHITGG